jgi:hypothetical protein
MWNDDMTPEEAIAEPIRAKIEAVMYLLWTGKGDLPAEVQEALDEITEDIKKVTYWPK